MRLVSVSGRMRRMMPWVDSVMLHSSSSSCSSSCSAWVFDYEEEDEDDFNCSGAMAPRLTMYLRPSATLMSSLVTLSSGARMRKPEVGLGVVGMKTQMSGLPARF